MIKIFLILFILIANAWSRVGLELVLSNPTIKQGEITNARLLVKHAEGQSNLTKLNDKNVGKTLYIVSLSPFMGKEGQLESEAKVVFFAVPQSNTISEVIDGEEIVITWDNIEVVPVNASQSFLLGDFEIPDREKIFRWIMILIGLVIFTGAFFWMKKKLAKKNALKEKLKLLKGRLVNCTSYEEIILMHGDKMIFLETFPQIKSHFQSFETILFKYQFKPHRTSSEIDEVLAAYQIFIKNISWGLK